VKIIKAMVTSGFYSLTVTQIHNATMLELQRLKLAIKLEIFYLSVLVQSLLAKKLED
jgi:hypothetical protein